MTSNSPRFQMTYESSADTSIADFRYRGFLPRSGVVPAKRNNKPKKPSTFSLKQAYNIFEKTYNGVDAVSANEFPLYCPRWISWSTNEGNISLHFEEISRPSRIRIAKLFGAE